MASKYQRYTIQITYLNGNKENIEYTNFKNINTSSYKEMLSIYNQTKEQYKNQSVTIDFMGVTPDEQVNVLFSKRIKQVDEEKADSYELIENIYNLVQKLKERRDYVSEQLCLLDKEKSIFEHKNIEFFDISLLTDEYKIQAFDEYRKLLIDRRNIKNEEFNFNNISEQIDVISGNVNRMYNRTIGVIKTAEKATIAAINNEVPEEKNRQVIKEYKYGNFKERINLMKQLEGKYDKIVNIDTEQKLVCYRKSVA